LPDPKLYTLKQIIENQSKFKEDIIVFLRKDMSNAFSILKNISTEDKTIKEHLTVFKKKVNKFKNVSVNDLFFMTKPKEFKYYAWWDKENEETIIYKYAQNNQ
jgi:hypothetical protein